MRYSFDGYNYFVRLDDGERLMESLERFVKKIEVQGAWLSGIGKVREATLGFYELKTKNYPWQTLAEQHEIVSLSGSLAFASSGELVAHLHGVFSNSHFQTVGGHVKDATASATIELLIQPTHTSLKRLDGPSSSPRLLDLPEFHD